MSSFIKALALLLADREELNINVKKIGNDLLIFSTPGKDTKRAVKQITIPEAELLQEDLDTKIIEEIGSKPNTSSATYQAADLPSGKKEKSESKKPAPAKKATKKHVANKPVKKAAAKKPDKKKPVPKAAPKAKRTVAKPTAKKPNTEKPKNAPATDEGETREKAADIIADGKTHEVDLPGASGAEEKVQPSSKEVFESVMKEAEKHASVKNWEDAEDAYLRALQMEPENALAKAGVEKCKKWLAALAKAEG